MKARTWWIVFAVGLAVVTAAGWTALRFSSQGRRAELATGYVAHIVCSCRYLGNRSPASCATDLEPGMEIVRMSEDATRRRITATVPWVVSRSATYIAGEGCTLDE